MAKIAVIQPLITNYRIGFFEELAQSASDFLLLADIAASADGFGEFQKFRFNFLQTRTIGRRDKIYFQSGIILGLLRFRPNIIFVTADFRSLNYWLILAFGCLFNVEIFSHGQGVYNKKSIGFFRRFAFLISISLSTRYICYTELSRQSLVLNGVGGRKLRVMENTLTNEVKVEKKTELSDKLGVAFIGRLREGSEVDLLIEAVKLLKDRGFEIEVHIVGEGILSDKYRRLVAERGLNFVFHGSMYSNQEIYEAISHCSLGIHPGDAGLSVVHYMSFGLIPIVHDSIYDHMGPEPSYIVNNQNGLTFARGSSQSLAQVLEGFFEERYDFPDLAKNAYETFQELNRDSMANKFLNIVREVDRSC